MTDMTHADDPLMVALDLPAAAEAEALVETLGEAASIYKIGYQLVPVGGFDLARRLGDRGKRVFLDLKYHDIGATVEKGVRSVRALGADFLTVHAERDVLRAAVEGRGDDSRLKILAVTVLTSLSQEDLAANGVTKPLADVVLERVARAAELGADGVVASPHEAAALRAHLGPDMLIVTPGVRPAGAALNDQKRVATPGAAIAAGASYLVVGRPITEAPDPAAAAQAIRAEALHLR